MSDDEKIIYIDALCELINRQPNTIRKWEREGRLPKHLLPKRGKGNWRYWTHGQVYGNRGLIKWIEKNDMRPGNKFANPENEKRHIKRLRRPKNITPTQITSAKRMAHRVVNGEPKPRNGQYIVRKLFPLTKYKSEEALYDALCRIAKQDGWEMPAIQVKSTYKRKK